MRACALHTEGRPRHRPKMLCKRCTTRPKKNNEWLVELVVGVRQRLKMQDQQIEAVEQFDITMHEPCE